MVASAEKVGPQPRILLVDDDGRLATLLRTYLQKEGFAVELAASARQARARLAALAIDLVVLDLMLPDANGLDLCRALRGEGHDVPIVMLTAKGDDVDRIVGLELGADDYLPKPCNPRELVARIKAVLRRRSPPVPGAPDHAGAPIRFGAFTIHPDRRMLERDGAEVPLSTAEFAVLYALASRPHETLTRERLLRLARGRDARALDRAIDVQISRLRRAIEADPQAPRYLQTVRGTGYVFVPDSAGSSGRPLVGAGDS